MKLSEVSKEPLFGRIFDPPDADAKPKGLDGLFDFKLGDHEYEITWRIEIHENHFYATVWLMKDMDFSQLDYLDVKAIRVKKDESTHQFARGFQKSTVVKKLKEISQSVAEQCKRFADYEPKKQEESVKKVFAMTIIELEDL